MLPLHVDDCPSWGRPLDDPLQGLFLLKMALRQRALSMALLLCS